ncbi:MAG: RNA polymerase factor sigma-54, partial [Pseudomonadota bacterium]
MKPSLQVRLSQHLALTPQLQQSIRLLQLSTLELQQEVGQMLEQNPFLEVEEEGASPFESPLDRPAADRVAEGDDAAGGDAAGDGEGLAEIRGDEFGAAAEREDWANGTEGDDFDGIRELPGAGSGAERDEGERDEAPAGAATLADHLRAQAVGMRLQDEDRAALHVLIESLDGDGYLADPLEEIAERPLAQGAGVPLDDYETDPRDALLARLRIALG